MGRYLTRRAPPRHLPRYVENFAFPASHGAKMAVAVSGMCRTFFGLNETRLHRWNPEMDELTDYLTNSAEDGFWDQIQSEAQCEADREPVLFGFLFASVLAHKKLEDGLSAILANKLHTPELPANLLRDLVNDALTEDVSIRASIRADLLAARTRDPAARGYAQPFLYYKGFHALQAYRVAHWLWGKERLGLAAHLQNRISEAFGVDVHPAAQIGCGVLIDHGTSVVIGETAVVEDNVSLLHEVTLGGTGKESGDRHPKVRRGVLIGAGARYWETSRLALEQKSPPVALCCETYRLTPPLPEYRRV